MCMMSMLKYGLLVECRFTVYMLIWDRLLISGPNMAVRGTVICDSAISVRGAGGIARTKRDGTRAETRFGLSAKLTSPFKSAGVSVQWTTGS